MKKLDLHVHCDVADPAAVAAFAALAEAENTLVGLSGGARYGAIDFVPNDGVLKIAREYPEVFIPLAKVDLWDAPGDPETIRRFAGEGFRALKCIYPYYEYDHDYYMPLYQAAAECGLPILFHTGNFRASAADRELRRPVLKNMSPLNIDRIARSFPELRIVIAHLGTTFWRREAAEMIKLHDNVYADLAGSGSWQDLSAADVVDLLRRSIHLYNGDFSGFAKLVLGSDGYVSQPEPLIRGHLHYEMLIDKIGLPAEVRDRIMGGTVAGWLGIKL